jgi:hypothetical protein
MIALVGVVYLPPALFDGGRTLLGIDYQSLHAQRIAFARQAILSGHGLPAWYPYDFLGAPFTANLQSFPWIPTRLLLLLLDPQVAYAAGVALAAALAAAFTFLFCRRAGLSRLGAAAAGWTFACAGFFSSRVAAGHLPLLEAYAALPLLLWAADRALASSRSRRRPPASPRLCPCRHRAVRALARPGNGPRPRGLRPRIRRRRHPHRLVAHAAAHPAQLAHFAPRSRR